MPKPQHTPGPWSIAGYKYNSPERIYDDIHFGNDKQNRICRVFMDDTKNQAANARLIAAAPDLLEALISCEARLYELGQEHDLSCMKARIAITKAKGE